MTLNGANQALRGYRLQTLYALSKIIESQNDNATFQLELYEDFAIVDQENTPLEIAQVKAYKNDLSFSILQNFFRRAAVQLHSTPDARIQVISFGPIGSQLERAWQEDGTDRGQIRKKLSEPSKTKRAKAKQKPLTQAEIDSVFSATDLIKVEEKRLQEGVFAFLRDTLAGGQPDHAFELLQIWLLRLSEESGQITYGELLHRLSNVGKYLRERELHYSEWFTTIKPLEDDLISKQEREKMRESFYQGIDANYRFILGDIDIVRERKLQRIEQSFGASNIVIVHGASGQGKSTLAYRYLHDYVPIASRFEVVAIEDTRHALDIARALSSHFQAIGTDMYVYIDVQPGNTVWTRVVRELSEYRSLKILITVREEDFRRIDTPGTALGLPETIDLTFDRVEGEEIYQNLTKYKTPEHILTFEEAWQRFGTAGPLLEFVYLITQNESLRERLTKQVKRLEDEERRKEIDSSELDLLRIVSSASAYGTRLDLSKLVNLLGLATPKATVARYEQEYLLRTSKDGRYVEGLHPLRSMILTELLIDPVLQPWHNNVKPIIETAVEEDLEAFLLFAFSRRSEARPQVIEVLTSIQPRSWLAASAILRSLLWLGVREQIAKDQDVINRAFTRFHSAWWMTLNCDLVSISREKSLSWVDSITSTGLISEEVIAEAYALRDEQSPVEETFGRAQNWLGNFGGHFQTPETVFEWLGFANVAFWLGHFQKGDALELISEETLNAACKSLPLEILADVVQALRAHESFRKWFACVRQILLERFQKETNTFFLEDDGNAIRAHFVVDLETHLPGIDDIQNADELLKIIVREINDEEQDIDSENQLHSETMQRVKLLKRLIPDRYEYGSQGYGHRWSSLDVLHDETEKNISTDYLLPKAATQINSFYSKLGTYSIRPDTWKDFAEPEFVLRKHVVEVLAMLQKALEGHFKKKTLVNIASYVNFDVWNACLSALTREPLLPKLAVDEWGFISDSDIKIINKKDSTNRSVIMKLNVPLALTDLRYFLEYRKKLHQGIHRFLPEALHVFKVNTFRARRTDLSLEERERAIRESKLQSNLGSRSQLNLNDAQLVLSKYQAEFRKHFGHFYISGELESLEKREIEIYRNVWSLWHQLVEHPSRRTQSPVEEARSLADKVIPQLKRQIEGDLKKLKKESVRASLVPIDLSWNEQSVLWIAVDSEPFSIYEDIPRVLETLQNSVGNLEYGSLKQVLLEQSYEQVCVLPLVEGKLITKSARRISSSFLFMGSVFGGKDWWNQAFHPLPDHMLKALGTQVWDDSRLEIVRRLASLIGNLCVLVAHLADLNRFAEVDLPEESDQKAIEILRSYLERRLKLINDVLQCAINTEVELLAFYKTAIEEDSFLVESLPVLQALHRTILPHPESEGEERAVKLSEMPEWLMRLEEASRQSEIIHIAWLEHIRRTS